MVQENQNLDDFWSSEYFEVEVALFEIKLFCFREAFLGRTFKIKVLFIDRDFYDQGHFLDFAHFLNFDHSPFLKTVWHFSLIRHTFRRSRQAFRSYFFFCAINFHDQFLSWLFNFFEGAFSPISFWSFCSHDFLSFAKYLSDQDLDVLYNIFHYFRSRIFHYSVEHFKRSRKNPSKKSQPPYYQRSTPNF